MRTTIDIEDDVLVTIKQIAHQRKTSAGYVVSSMLREALQPKPFQQEYRNGVPLLPRRPGGLTLTPELVNQLRDEDE